METLTKARVKEVSEKIQTFLDKLSEEEGIKMTMNGGAFTPSSFILKIDGKLLTDEGLRFVDDRSNSVADLSARRDGISFTTPHFIGSVWRFASSGLVRVEEYSTKNRKYPYICSVYGEDKRIKATASSFLRGKEIPMPSTATFLLWFITDVEDDRITQLEEDTCDSVNDFISVKFDGDHFIDEFFDACGEYFDKHIAGKKKATKKVEYLTADLYRLLINENNVKGALECLEENL